MQMSFEVFHNVVVMRAFNIAKAAHVGSTRPLVLSPSSSHSIIFLLLQIFVSALESRLSLTQSTAMRIQPAGMAARDHPLLGPLQVRSGEVARILADLEASDSCIAAALLHNALESSMLTEQKLREAMSPEVCNIVCNVAKMSDICKV